MTRGDAVTYETIDGGKATGCIYIQHRDGTVTITNGNKFFRMRREDLTLVKAPDRPLKEIT